MEEQQNSDYKKFLSQMNDLCVEAITNGDNDNRHHAIVMLYSRLCELELAFGVLESSMIGIKTQLDNPLSSTYLTLTHQERNNVQETESNE